MTDNPRPTLGPGLGWRPELAWLIERRAGLGFVEIIAEAFQAPGPLPSPIKRLRERGVAVVPHGLGLSLGGAEPLEPARLEALASLARRVDAPLVSEHIAFVRAEGEEAGHLLPVPRTRAMLDLLVENVQLAQRSLPVPLALENIAALLEWPGAEMDEGTFLTELLRRTGALLLLDLANVFANARNHGRDPSSLLRQIPLDRVAYVHLAGGIDRDGLYHDSHAHPIRPEVLGLLEDLASMTEIPGTLLERDDRFPSDAEIAIELDAIDRAVARGASRRLAAHALAR